jgi:hypothetical protein
MFTVPPASASRIPRTEIRYSTKSAWHVQDLADVFRPRRVLFEQAGGSSDRTDSTFQEKSEVVRGARIAIEAVVAAARS